MPETLRAKLYPSLLKNYLISVILETFCQLINNKNICYFIYKTISVIKISILFEIYRKKIDLI
jgi:hypothetical protein